MSSRSTPSPRPTQCTIKTSTPVAAGRTPATFISSPSVSACSSEIHQQRQCAIIRQRSDDSSLDESSSAATSTVGTTTFFDDEDEQLTGSTKKRRVNKKSKDYLEFYPKREDGLYKKLMQEEVDDIEDITLDLLVALKIKPHTGLLTLFEYFLDLCGFQHLDMRKIYTSIDLQLETVIQLAQNNLTAAHKNGKYLMKARTNYPEKVVGTACCFIENLVMNDNNFLLFHVNKPNNVVKFVSVMCSNQHRAICHTGCIIAIKMNSAYSSKCYQLNTAVNRSFSVGEELRTITQVQRSLWQIIERVSHRNDRWLVEMRCACAKEMLQWFKMRPEHFFESDIYINDFLKFFVDSSEKVRLVAIETCKKMFLNYDRFCGYLEPFKEGIVAEVIKRIDDVNFDVAAKAVDVCTCLIDFNKNMEVVASRLPTLILCNHYPYAAACARFCDTFLRHTKETFTASDILDRIIKIYTVIHKIDRDDEVALMVEALLDFTPELQNWNLFIDRLLSPITDLTADKYYLLEFFCQSIMQTVTGKCAVVREKPRRADPRKSVNRNILATVTPHIHTFLNLYGKRKENALLLFETINIMPFSLLAKTEQNEQHMTCLYTTLVEFFKHTKDMELALHALKTIKKLCDKDNYHHFQKQAIEFCDKLENEILDCFNNHSGVSADLKTVWMRIAVAMEVTDISKKVCWSQIFTYNLRYSVECLEYQLLACKWFINHQTPEFIKNYLSDKNNNIIYLEEISKEIREYVKYLFDLLVDDAEDTALEAFKRICEMKVLMDKILEEPTKVHETFSVLRINMSDKTVQQKFCDVLRKKVIDTSSPFDLKTRRMYLNYALHWLVKGEPLKQLHTIISFYGEYYEEFGYIFNETLKVLRTYAPLTFILVVHESLLHVFMATEFNNNDLLHSMKEAAALKKLTKQIVQTCINTSADALRFIRFSIKYVIRNLQHLHFFFILTYFVEHLSAPDCTVLYENLKAEIPQESRTHPAYLNFMLALKNKMPKSKTPRKPRSKKVVSSEESFTISTSSDSYSIQDDSD